MSDPDQMVALIQAAMDDALKEAGRKNSDLRIRVIELERALRDIVSGFGWSEELMVLYLIDHKALDRARALLLKVSK